MRHEAGRSYLSVFRSPKMARPRPFERYQVSSAEETVPTFRLAIIQLSDERGHGGFLTVNIQLHILCDATRSRAVDP